MFQYDISEDEDSDNPKSAATLDGFGKEANDDDDPTASSRGFFFSPLFCSLLLFSFIGGCIWLSINEVLFLATFVFDDLLFNLKLYTCCTILYWDYDSLALKWNNKV